MGDHLGDRGGDQVSERLREAAYAAVGLGVLGVQRLQVRRRDIAKLVEPQVRDVAKRVEPQVRDVAERMEPQVRDVAVQLQRLATATDQAVDPVLDRLEERLSDTTRDLVRSARTAAVDARDTVLKRVASGSGPPD